MKNAAEAFLGVSASHVLYAISAEQPADRFAGLLKAMYCIKELILLE